MTSYPFPSWRRIPFIALLIVILVISYGPSITQGTINVRVYALIPQGIVNHVYVRFDSVRLHEEGYPQGTGTITLSQIIPRIDLVPTPGQFMPSTISSSTVVSGRFDTVTVVFSNSTVVLDGRPGKTVSTGPVLSANATIAVPPNGRGDLLIILSLDYTQLITDNPTISAQIHQVTAA